MKSPINQILKPNRIIKILYGIISLICVTAYVWIVSFVWLFSVTHFIIGLIALILTLLTISIQFDKRYKWKTKYYFVVSLIQILIVWTIANPIREWQIISSITKAQLIIDQLENYNRGLGQYPNSLEDIEMNLGIVIPKRTNIGTRYWYEKVDSYNYRLCFYSYYGNQACFFKQANKWTITD